ncbi:MAG: tRNA lysidine(34) synthetase TilS [Bacteroidota bacterium]|nr:tRNA lysidine(34) synthetase TilS [Bacteroidota bacterium]
MLGQIKKYIKDYNLFSPSARLLIAVSGGVDSMVCLNVLSGLGYTCGIAHCNFQLRGSESDEDEVFVRSLATQLNIPFYCQGFNTREYADENGLSIQMAARDLRYTWFESLRASEKYDYIILAHQGDDSVETLLINLARGTGLRGLTGIKAKSGNIRRPLLCTNRKSILSYADNNKVAFREDSSNLKTDYTRNRIRHIITPEFNKINPSFSKTVLSNIENFKEEQEVLDQRFVEIEEIIVKHDDNEIKLSINKLLELPQIHWFLFKLLSGYGFNTDQVRSLINCLTDPPGKQFNSERYSLIKDREFIFLTIRNIKIVSEYLLNVSAKSISIPVKLEMSEIPISMHSISSDLNTADIDLEKIVFPLKLRRWIPGDYFYPLGMSKAKKLSDFFIDEKIPRHKKDKIWILCSGEDIIWLMGLRMDDRFKITRDTSTVFQISLKSEC